jgi:replicative DNA helicase
MLTEEEDVAELAVLGAVIATGGRALDDITIHGDDFRQYVHGEIFDTMRRMHEAGQHVDSITLIEQMPKHDVLILSLTDHTPFATAVQSYAEIVAVHGMKRKLMAATDGIRGIGMADMTAADMLDEARGILDRMGGTPSTKVRFVRDILPDVIARMNDKTTFVPSPWPTLDAAIGGFRPGAVYVVAARPGMGKTVVAAQVAAKLAQQGVVAFSSLEMSEDELVSRLIAERLAIMVGKIKDNRMTDYDWGLLHSRRSELDELNIAIDDRSNISASDVRAFARSVSRHGQLAGVVVDYLQLMTSRSKQDRHLQVAEFSRQLKILAKDMRVPVIALSQLNRQSESRADNIPKLSDLRESGAIEQDADCVFLLRREGEGASEELIIDVAKNRHGETGEVHLAWQGEFSRAVEWN